MGLTTHDDPYGGSEAEKSSSYVGAVRAPEFRVKFPVRDGNQSAVNHIGQNRVFSNFQGKKIFDSEDILFP